jgi:hypothetical protein
MKRLNFIPKAIKEKSSARAWLLLCVAVLVFGWIQRDIHDMPEAFIYLMIALTVPIGFLVAITVGTATSYISQALNISYHPFWDLMPFWLSSTVLGYVQWFILVPWLRRKIQDW